MDGLKKFNKEKELVLEEWDILRQSQGYIKIKLKDYLNDYVVLYLNSSLQQFTYGFKYIELISN